LTKRITTAFRGVSCSTTLTETGSDQHQRFHRRLCSAFRFSQPLDALLHLQPLQPCFMPVAPLSFSFQRFSLRSSGRASRRHLPSLPFIDDWLPCRPGRRFDQSRLRGFTHPRNPYHAGRYYPVTASRSSPSVDLFEVCPTRLWLRASTEPPLLGFSTTVDVAVHGRVRSSKF